MTNTAATDPAARARAWAAADPDPSTRAELESLIESGDRAELAERMDGTLRFGTAGLRGAVEAGSNRMNRATVIRTARGLADFLAARQDGPPPGPVVLGRDARLSSFTFMADAAAVLAAAGLEVRYWEDPVPTPLVAYATAALGACAGVAVTASHNPPGDNGCKVYDAGGVQITPPADAGIAAAVDRVGGAAGVPRAEGALEGRLRGVRPIEAAVLEGYRRAAAGLRAPGAGDPGLRIVYTPLHGVGLPHVRAVLAEAGYEDLHPVPEQAEPDGSFPTVRFPNPEEPGSMDLALGLAGSVEADLVLANDPDADRLAAAVPGPGGWTVLTGNQVGALLADYLLPHYRGAARPLVVDTIVSSPMTALVAEAYGARHETALTGFKWIAAAALDLEAAGEAEFVFGFEEALGYSIGGEVKDKDGISAALILADLAAECRRRGMTLADRLSGLYRRFGLWASAQRSVRRPGSAGAAAIGAAMDRLGARPPRRLGGAAVASVKDYRAGAGERPRWLGAAALIVLELEGGSRVLARPSGTEPKLKVYADVTAPAPKKADLRTLERSMIRRAGQIASELVRYMGLDG